MAARGGLLLALLGGGRARDVLLFDMENNHTIMQMELDGSTPFALITGCGETGPRCPVNYPDDQKVSVKQRKVYWSNMGSGVLSNCMMAKGERTGSVWRADWPSGMNPEVVVPPGTIGCAKQLYLDELRMQLYVGDKGHITAGVWRIDIGGEGGRFPIEAILQHQEWSSSAVSLDATGEKVLTAADGEGLPPGIGVFNRVIPPGMNAAAPTSSGRRRPPAGRARRGRRERRESSDRESLRAGCWRL